MRAGRAEKPGKSQAARQPEYGVPRGEDESLVELPEGAVGHEESRAAQKQVERLPRRRRPPRAPTAQVACNHDSPEPARGRMLERWLHPIIRAREHRILGQVPSV